jgi:hypothetical protein
MSHALRQAVSPSTASWLYGFGDCRISAIELLKIYVLAWEPERDFSVIGVLHYRCSLPTSEK